MSLSVPDIIDGLFTPLRVATYSPRDMNALLNELGIIVTLNEAQYTLFQSALSITENLTLLISHLSEISQIKNQDDINGELIANLIIDSQNLFNDIRALETPGPEIAQLPSPLNEQDTWRNLAQDLPEYLIVNWVNLNLPLLYELFHFTGIIVETERDEGLPVKREILWEKLGDFFSNPVTEIQNKYQWGGDLQHDILLENLVRVFYAVGFFPDYQPAREELTSLFFADPAQASVKEIALPLYDDWLPNTPVYFDASLVMLPIPPSPSASVSGLALTVAAEGSIDEEINIADDWKLHIESEQDLNGAFSVMVHPTGADFAANAPSSETKFTLKIEPQKPWVLFGDREGTRLELGGLHAALGVKLAGSNPDITLSAKTTGGPSDPSAQGIKFAINPGDGDSFIAKVLGENELAITADAGFTWSSQNGFTFEGGAGFEIVIPIDKTLGPIQLELIRLALAGGTDGIRFEAAVTGGLDISVISVVVNDIGLRATLYPADDGNGLIGPFDVKLGLKPPTGLGMTVNAAGIVKGGGYVEHDEEKAQYAGVAEIQFVKLGLSAIGILTTRMPDGSKDWSLFLSIFSTFPPINIGFGFTLDGVGGLVGINRALDDQALRERLLTGAMDSIMFPEDPVANAPRIINDIEAVFPPVKDQFIFGAMFKLGWGGGTSLITVELGVLVELPDPIRIAILGQLEAMFPNKALPIVEMHIDVFGLIDITGGKLSIDGVLRDSCIRLDPTKKEADDKGMITLSGDMAMRAEFQGRPSMLLSVGGFHPKFTPPDNFPTLRRMKVSMPNIPGVGLELATYVAITPNTFQIGGRLDVWAKFSGFSAEGYIEFDVLIQFQPFGFDFHTAFGVTVKAGSVTLMGVDVSTDIKGPGYWEVNGYARFEILKVKKKINLEITMGKKKSNPAETYNVSQLVYEALSDIGNWNIIEDEELAGFVRLSDASKDNPTSLNPNGLIQVIQKIAPLNVEIQEFASGKVTGAKKYEIDNVYVGSTQRAPAEDDFMQEWFSPASFFKMNDKEKLAAPSFEEMDGGLQIGTTDIATGSSEELTIEHEEICVDPSLNQRRKFKKKQQSLETDLLKKFSGQSTKARLFKENTQILDKSKKPKFEIKKTSHKVINMDTGKVFSPTKTSRPVTFAEAQFALNKENAKTFTTAKRYDLKSY